MKIKDLFNEQLAARESTLRDRLPLMSRWSKEYETLWEEWFYLREAGLARGIFKFFVPS